MTYLDQALAGDWFGIGVCHSEIARFALERAKAEIERLAKERCGWCQGGDAPTCINGRWMHGVIPCQAQPEQRRLAELEKDLAALKATERKDAKV